MVDSNTILLVLLRRIIFLISVHKNRVKSKWTKIDLVKYNLSIFPHLKPLRIMLSEPRGTLSNMSTIAKGVDLKRLIPEYKCRVLSMASAKRTSKALLT